MKLLGSEHVGVVPYDDDNHSSTVWNEKNKEITFNETYETVDGKNYDNLMVKIGMYKDDDINNFKKIRLLYNVKAKKVKYI
ncbi:hypothetical protein ALNOE001_09360 [Candidatus Methanobinarius endosymbioticus]|uniref:Uncharacterized protein n=1 Tax=Candidatus Methanobinarius endosymbioticus TaxID=2006182 RepID=A0A366MC22_9EURY|nr:hypothetical protein ALNOE001_09360 [Candidatus Methanobinarius endosymbioticus]